MAAELAEARQASAVRGWRGASAAWSTPADQKANAAKARSRRDANLWLIAVVLMGLSFAVLGAEGTTSETVSQLMWSVGLLLFLFLIMRAVVRLIGRLRDR